MNENEYDFSWLNPENKTIPRMPEQIETERLILRPMVMADAVDILKNSDQSSKSTMQATDIQGIERVLEFRLARMKAGIEYIFSITDKDGKFIGEVSLTGGSLPRPKAEPDINIWLSKEKTGQGIAEEAVKSMIDWANNNLDINFYLYRTNADNKSSNALAKKLNGELVEHDPEVNENFYHIIPQKGG